MRIRPVTGMILLLVVLGIALAGMLFRREMRARAMPDTRNWKMYHNDFLNFRVWYPAAWTINDTADNERQLPSLSQAKQVLTMTQAKAAGVHALPIGTVTFSPLTYDPRTCGDKRLRDCPGFASVHSAAVTLQAFYEPLELVPAGEHPKRHNPFDAGTSRACSYSMVISFSRNDIDHVFTLCVDWKEAALSKAQQDIVIQQYQALFEQFYSTFEYLRTPTI